MKFFRRKIRSLVEGGKCRYCDNEIDYASYDWIVVDYKHTNEL